MNVRISTRRGFIKATFLGGAVSQLVACTWQLKPPQGAKCEHETLSDSQVAKNSSDPNSIPPSIELASPQEAGERLVISGTIFAENEETPLEGVLISVWHTDVNGEYGRFNGLVRTNSNGCYQIQTIRPSPYSFDDVTRASHIHFSVDARNMRNVSGELLFEGDPLLATDPVVLEEDQGVVAARTLSLVEVEDNNGKYYRGQFNVVLEER